MSAREHNSPLVHQRRRSPGWVAALALIAAVPEVVTAAPSAAMTAPAEDADSWVLFITIVGEHTYLHWGHPGDRPPRIDDLAATDPRQLHSTAAGNTQSPRMDPAVVAVDISSSGTEPTYGGDDPGQRPFGPAPQECPHTLPAGSDAGTAEALLEQSGCRYLSSCENDGSCTWHYQGRVFASES